MSFFGLGKKTPKSPQELVKAINEEVVNLDKKKDAKAAQKSMEEVSKHVSTLKSLLYGTDTKDADEEALVAVVVEIHDSGFFSNMISKLPDLEFEARKDAAAIVNNLLRRKTADGNYPSAEYVLQNPHLLMKLVEGYENKDVCLCAGSILRECIKHESIAKHILESELFPKFFEYVQDPNFEIASDAFESLKELLTRHRAMCAEFMEKKFETVFNYYNHLLVSDNYVVKRQSSKFLSELLLDRANFQIMARYISDPDNLKVVMTLLKTKSSHIQFEGFHVFKVFVANPNKPDPIKKILGLNQEKLLDLLANFLPDKDDDEQFVEEKEIVRKEIESLPGRERSQSGVEDAAQVGDILEDKLNNLSLNAEQ